MAQTAELPDFLELVSNAEGDMRRVYDHAFLLHDHLSSADPLTPDEQAALNWPAYDLLEAGRRLREHCEAMYDAALLYRAAERPRPMADLRDIVALIEAHIDARSEHDRLFALNDEGLVSDQVVMDALGPIDDALMAICAARPADAPAAARRAEYLNATLWDAITRNEGLGKATIAALIEAGGAA